MKNSIIENPSFTDNCLVEPIQRTGRIDHDVREIAIGFGQIPAANIRQPMRKDFGTTTLGDVTFRRVDPLREPFQVADARLQSRLESLCEKLRAKY